MNKELLIKHISGAANAQEEKHVLAWITKSDANRQYYKNLKNVWVSQTLPKDIVKEEDMAQIRELTYKRTATQVPKTAQQFYGKNTQQEQVITAQQPQFRSLKRALYFASSVAAIAIIGLLITIYKYELGHREVDYNRIALAHVPTEYRHTLYTENGVKARLTLPDSSQVWLNSGSTIVYPDKFYGDTREIEFKGEAYFKVRKDSLHPMIITTNKNFTIEVIGTEFNVKSYDEDKTAQTTLYSGAINLVSDAGGKVVKTQIKPFETCFIGKEKLPEISPIAQKIAKNTVAWREGRLVFVATPMSEVIKILERWHGVEIEITDPNILAYKITADFYSESMVQIATILKFCALVDYKIENNKFIFFSR
ncbi:MAG: FecR domain-containing protein [Bacteroidales bacterium]